MNSVYIYKLDLRLHYVSFVVVAVVAAFGSCERTLIFFVLGPRLGYAFVVAVAVA